MRADPDAGTDPGRQRFDGTFADRSRWSLQIPRKQVKAYLKCVESKSISVSRRQTKLRLIVVAEGRREGEERNTWDRINVRALDITYE